MSGRARTRRVAAVGAGALVLAAAASGVGATRATAAPAAFAPLTKSQAAALSHNVTDKVIVLLRTQTHASKIGSAAETAREATQARSQASILSELRATGAQHVEAYKLVNAIAATVSSGEAKRLATDPAVESVSGDAIIKGPDDSPSEATAATSAATATAAATRTVPAGDCSTNRKEPQLDPEALQITKTQSQDSSVPTARSLGFTGAGVKVAYMAEGIDIHNPNFIRPNGTPAFVDYKDFSGDGTAAATSGDEAFLDASAIGAQGTVTYNLKNFGAVPLAQNCWIKIVGEAPGAELVGLKIFANNNDTTESGFLEAIDYAVTVDHVNVLNESFGSNPFPDVTSLDATKQFNDAAVAAGTTVTVSSGDSGPTSTIGSPSDDPLVISSGASTTYRFYAQSGYAGFQAPIATGGYVDDQISPLSSSGFAQDGTTLDEVAPGDINVASCTASPKYSGCLDFAGKSSNIEESGGTSESAPTTAGIAALVIQAYGKTHGGALPTPALVKQIITSTTDDLNAPAEQQGTGRVDAYRAVLAAESVSTADGTPKPVGSSLLLGKTQLNAVGAPGSTATFTDTITNTGIGTDTIALGDRVLGAPTVLRTTRVTLAKSNPHFTDYAGDTTDYQTVTFKVPTGVDRLKADIAYPGNPALGNNNRVRLLLIDPLGRYDAHSLPQGVGNAGDVQLSDPAAGVWTAVIYSRSPSVNGLTGIVPLRVEAENYVSTGSVTPSSVTIAPGKTKRFSVSLKTPASPGDAAVAVTLADGDQKLTLPVTLRSEIEPGAATSDFTGDDTGGNGRPDGGGQAFFYSLKVPAGTKNITADISLKNNPLDTVYATLVNPQGDAVGYSSNATITSIDADGDANVKPGLGTSVYALNPEAGVWRLLVDFDTVTGTQLDQPFYGHVTLDGVEATAPLPDAKSSVLPAGKATTVPVTVTNTGVAPEDYFVDARLAGSATIPVTLLEGASTSVPLTPESAEPIWLTPTETTSVSVDETSNAPIEFDYGAYVGDPDLASDNSGTSASGTFSSSEVAPGFWFAAPDLMGPYGVRQPASHPVSTTVSITTRPFDQTVTSAAGDLWLGALTGNPSVGIVQVAPGHTVTIPVTITPTGKAGSVVSGTLFVDQLSEVTQFGLLPNGSELSALPYTYKIG